MYKFKKDYSESVTFYFVDKKTESHSTCLFLLKTGSVVERGWWCLISQPGAPGVG